MKKTLTKQQIINRLLKDFEEGEDRKEHSKEIYHSVNDKVWTIADLFIRQWLNNGSNGFGMKRVKQNYEWLCEIKEKLIEYNLVNRNGFNNSGFELWTDYGFDWI